MKDKVSVVLGKAMFEHISGRRYRSHDAAYGKTLDVLNSEFSDGALYRVKDGEFQLYLDRLEGAFVLRSDRFTKQDFFTVTYKEKYVPPKSNRGGKVSVEWMKM